MPGPLPGGAYHGGPDPPSATSPTLTPLIAARYPSAGVPPAPIMQAPCRGPGRGPGARVIASVAERASGGSGEPTVRRPTVLVVDDEHYIVDLLADLLEEEGYRVDRAYDGVDALEAIARSAPDVVVADVMMPRLDGLSFVGRLRERGDPIPVVLMSAAVTPRNPGVTFVAKPFDIDHMLSVIADILQGPFHTGSPDLCLNGGNGPRGPDSAGSV